MGGRQSHIFAETLGAQPQHMSATATHVPNNCAWAQLPHLFYITGLVPVHGCLSPSWLCPCVDAAGVLSVRSQCGAGPGKAESKRTLCTTTLRLFVYTLSRLA